MHLLFLAAGLVEDKAHEKGQSMFTFFSNPLLCLKLDNFKITQTDEEIGTEDYFTVSLVLKVASCFEILTITGY